MRNFENEDECRSCGNCGTKKATKVACQYCQVEFVNGRTEYWCEECENDWTGGRTHHLTWYDDPVCEKCATREAGTCVICDKTVCISNARSVEAEIVCNDCYNKVELVWCPKCGKSFSSKGYLNFIFRKDRAGLHAAAMVTHYRHTHVVSHDRAWSNRNYANAIPVYNYDEYKAKVNNQAKRQLIRSIARHIKENTYPETAPIDGRKLILAFRALQENDGKTIQLIETMIAKVGGPSKVAGE